MTVIGITGGSGSGKSTLSALLREEFGALVLDADEIYHELLDSCDGMRAALTEAFGEGILEEGRISRPKLAAVVFSDANALTTLNAITHPRVCDEIRRRLAVSDRAVAAVDAFGLLQSGLDSLCHHTVGIVADREIRIRRIAQRDGISEDRAAARIDAQAPEKYYRDHCGSILTNNGTEEAFREECRRLCCKLLGKEPN